MGSVTELIRAYIRIWSLTCASVVVFFKEEALYYRLKASHDLALRSTPRRKETRIKDAIKAYEKLKRNFPKTKYLEDSNNMLANLEKEQKQLIKS